MQLFILAMIFSPIVMGILIYAIDHQAFSRGIFLLQLALTAALGTLALEAAPFLRAGTGLLFVAGDWSSRAGIEFRLDRVSSIFVLMTVLAFWYVYLYVWWSRKGDHKFLFFLSMLQGALLGLFTVNDLFSMFVLIELITIACSILITYKKDGISVKAGLYYLLYNSIAMLLFLLGIIFLYQRIGTVNLTLMGELLPQYAGDSGYRWAIALIFSAFCLKSAIFPVYSWLPLAHASAPASVSALLSGLVVKSGLFILLRLGALVFIPGVRELLLILGIISGLFGAAMAFCQSDIKRILAYHTISQVGLIVIGLSVPNNGAEMGALLHIFNHFLFKSLLFLCAGTLITITGERHVGKIRGVFKGNPVLGICMAVGILGITGAPLFNGSISKALIMGTSSIPLAKLLILLINAGTVLSFVKLAAVLTGPRTSAGYPVDARIASPIFMAALVILSYPAEWMLIAGSSQAHLLPVIGHFFSETVKYLLMVMAAVGIYNWAYLPNNQQFKRFDSTKYSFHRGVGILTVFLAFLSLVLV